MIIIIFFFPSKRSLRETLITWRNGQSFLVIYWGRITLQNYRRRPYDSQNYPPKKCLKKNQNCVPSRVWALSRP